MDFPSSKSSRILYLAALAVIVVRSIFTLWVDSGTTTGKIMDVVAGFAATALFVVGAVRERKEARQLQWGAFFVAAVLLVLTIGKLTQF